MINEWNEMAITEELTCRMMMRKVGILTTDPTSCSSWRRLRWVLPAEGVIRSWPAWPRGSAAYSRLSTPMVRLIAATDRNAKRQPSIPRGCESPAPQHYPHSRCAAAQ